MTVRHKLGLALGIVPMVAWCLIAPWGAPVWVWSGYTVWGIFTRGGEE